MLTSCQDCACVHLKRYSHFSAVQHHCRCVVACTTSVRPVVSPLLSMGAILNRRINAIEWPISCSSVLSISHTPIKKLRLYEKLKFQSRQLKQLATHRHYCWLLLQCWYCTVHSKQACHLLVAAINSSTAGTQIKAMQHCLCLVGDTGSIPVPAPAPWIGKHLIQRLRMKIEIENIFPLGVSRLLAEHCAKESFTLNDWKLWSVL